MKLAQFSKSVSLLLLTMFSSHAFGVSHGDQNSRRGVFPSGVSEAAACAFFQDALENKGLIYSMTVYYRSLNWPGLGWQSQEVEGWLFGSVSDCRTLAETGGRSWARARIDDVRVQFGRTSFAPIAKGYHGRIDIDSMFGFDFSTETEMGFALASDQMTDLLSLLVNGKYFVPSRPNWEPWLMAFPISMEEEFPDNAWMVGYGSIMTDEDEIWFGKATLRYKDWPY